MTTFDQFNDKEFKHPLKARVMLEFIDADGDDLGYSMESGSFIVGLDDGKIDWVEGGRAIQAVKDFVHQAEEYGEDQLALTEKKD